jgi:hypothetical protein
LRSRWRRESAIERVRGGRGAGVGVVGGEEVVDGLIKRVRVVESWVGLVVLAGWYLFLFVVLEWETK